MLNSCWDNPRKSDYEYSEVFGALGTVPIIEFPKDKLIIPNQGADEETQMSCTRQGLANITNGNNLINQGIQEEGLAKRLWLDYCKLYPLSKTNGASLQSSLDQFLNEKLIAGYTKANSIEKGKSAIDSGKFIFTGSSNGNWNSVASKKLYALRTDGKIVGHAFCIIGYDDNGFIGLNSYGTKNGYFTIPFDLYTTLFTRYSVSDFVDETLILNYKKKMQQEIIDKAIELGITNGTELERPILRREAILMIMKMYNILKEK